MAPDHFAAPWPAAANDALPDPADLPLLRFITCGSVDDGKSSLIGRLLYEAKALFDDQMEALEKDSRRHGTRGGAIDFALLVDGLSAEREQGITIDVAYRFFATQRRKFIVADTPGHEQYTRNMVTGASTASLAVILIDARKGVLTQTRRHSFLVSLMGIRHVVLAVNKMDLVGFDPARFETIVAEYQEFAGRLGFSGITAIPLCATDGDNVTGPSARTPWYQGPSLMQALETVALDDPAVGRPFRLPVQWVNRPDLDFRGFAGLIAAGRVRVGDRVRVLPSGRESVVRRVIGPDGDLGQAVAGQSVTLTLADEIDISRGDLLVAPERPARTAQSLLATLVWMVDTPLVPGRPFLLKLGTRTVNATVTAIRHAVDVNSMAEQPATQLPLNAIALCELSLDRPLAFDPYADNPATGGFILIDRQSHETAAAGLVRDALGTTRHVRWQDLDVTRNARAAQKGQKPCILWFTGLSGAGKSTIANLVEKKLHALGHHTYVLDGDNLRHQLNADLGFSDADRAENVRRVAQVARLMADAGLIVLVSLISPFRAQRDQARALMPAGSFVEVFVDTPLEVSERRDVKGLYARARAGEIKGFTGLDSPYEAPESPEIRLETTTLSPEAAADTVVAWLEGRGLLTAETLMDGAAI